MDIPKVIDSVVNNDLCIGCGLCVYKCPNNALEMKWNKYGFLIPELTGNCDSDGSCISVCPFNPFPKKEVKTENDIAEFFLQENKHYHPKIGKYINIYAGYSNEFRLTSSSGGIATFIFTELLERGIVDHIFSVKESHKTGVYYEYAVSSSKEELLYASKTKYFPVTLGAVLPKIHELKGKVAIVGVACFIKAIRLAQYNEPVLKEKIPFLVGIICGGVKSRFFTDYLAGKAGVSNQNFEKPEFRIKDFKSTAGDYSFGCINNENKKEYTIKMRTVGDMWGTGFFKNNACDFCDDITTELADISLGDAWFEPYNRDGKGTNIVITRSTLADYLIENGKLTKQLYLDKSTYQQVLLSQRGNYNHREKALNFRIEITNKHKTIPPKRVLKNKISLDYKLVQLLRIWIRKQSLIIWHKTLNAEKFEKKIRFKLYILKGFTKIYHLLR